MSTPAIVLAAGASRRFGAPKQIAEFGDEALVNRVVQVASDAGLRPIVVLGAHRHAVEEVLDGEVERVFNPQWREGMASSIRCGVEYVVGDEEPLRLVICAGDQPLLSSDDFRHLVATCAVDEIAAAAYDDIVGIPACFPARTFSELLRLDGDWGARSLLRGERFDVRAVSMPAAAYDVDEPGDLQKLRR